MNGFCVMMKNKQSKSKFISKILRHEPPEYPIRVNRKGGWVKISELLPVAGITMEDLEEIVATDEKKRYSFNSDKTCVRANQGHSIDVDMGFEPQEPPEVLYHGTGQQNLGSIRKEGLVLKPSGPGKKPRQYVHLSKDVPTAVNVGHRKGKVMVLLVRSGQMFRDGYEFFLSENGVWLTKAVPSSYIKFPGECAGKKE